MIESLPVPPRDQMFPVQPAAQQATQDNGILGLRWPQVDYPHTCLRQVLLAAMHAVGLLSRGRLGSSATRLVVTLSGPVGVMHSGTPPAPLALPASGERAERGRAKHRTRTAWTG